uniref:Uncharacterized protein n=1 Tax=Globisporangium ultimum (strain ATCC 200006 / CBS 805.95 / DAOM BR144) TaxID=431595 RepID=K3WMS8_GLOUD
MTMMMSVWDAIENVDDVPVLAANWAEFFRAMCNERGGYTKFGEEVMATLTAHCDAMNALDGRSMDEYMCAVDDRMSELSKHLAHCRCLLEASAGLNVANAAPTVVAATNFWNPVGWIAGAVSVSALSASIGCKVSGESALEKMAAMIQESPLVIEERTSENAITRTASTMLPLSQLIKRKFGEEKAKAAYFVLLGALMAYSEAKMFDLDKIPQVVAVLINVSSSNEFSTLLQYVRDASQSRLTPNDAAEQFGAKMRASTTRLVGAITDQSFSALTIAAGCVLKPICKNLDKGLEVLLLAMQQGSIQWDTAQLAARQAQVATIFELAGMLSIAFSVVAIIGAVVSVGFGIAELVGMNARLEPYKQAIGEMRTSHREFAEAIEEVPRLLREYNQARAVGNCHVSRSILTPSSLRIQ